MCLQSCSHYDHLMCGLKGLKIVGLKKRFQNFRKICSVQAPLCHSASSFSTVKVTCAIHHHTIWSFSFWKDLFHCVWWTEWQKYCSHFAGTVYTHWFISLLKHSIFKIEFSALANQLSGGQASRPVFQSPLGSAELILALPVFWLLPHRATINHLLNILTAVKSDALTFGVRLACFTWRWNGLKGARGHKSKCPFEKLRCLCRLNFARWPLRGWWLDGGGGRCYVCTFLQRHT